MSELRDALDRWDNRTTHTPPDHEGVALLVDAARLVAEGEGIRWCNTHRTEVLEDEALICSIGRQGAAYYPCNVDPKLLIDPPEKT